MEEILKEGRNIKTTDNQTIYNSGGAAGIETIILIQKSAASTEDQKDPKLMPAQLKSILGRHQSADVRNIANQLQPKRPTLDSGLPIISAGNLSKLAPNTAQISLTQRYRRRDKNEKSPPDNKHSNNQNFLSSGGQLRSGTTGDRSARGQKVVQFQDDFPMVEFADDARRPKLLDLTHMSMSSIQSMKMSKNLEITSLNNLQSFDTMEYAQPKTARAVPRLASMPISGEFDMSKNDQEPAISDSLKVRNKFFKTLQQEQSS